MKLYCSEFSSKLLGFDEFSDFFGSLTGLCQKISVPLTLRPHFCFKAFRNMGSKIDFGRRLTFKVHLHTYIYRFYVKKK